MPRLMRSTVAPRLLALALALSVLPASARGFPRAHGIYFEPGRAEHIVLRSDEGGLVETRDAGTSWVWTCAEAYEGTSLDTDRDSVAVLPGGTVLVANGFHGLLVSAGNDLCDFRSVPALAQELVLDVALTNFSVVTAVTGLVEGEPYSARLWGSADQGYSWYRIGTPWVGAFSATSARFAPSDSQRVYVSGQTVGDLDNATIQRSDDGGRTWRAFTIPLTTPDWVGRLPGVDPNDANVLFFWKDVPQSGPHSSGPDELWMSIDGAETWSQIFVAKSDLPGFAFSPDGSILAIASGDDGLWTAKVSDLKTRGRAALARVFDGKIWGLNWTDTGLFAGTDDFSMNNEPHFTLGVSTDEGGSFAPVMSKCDVTASTCSADSHTGRVCAPAYASEISWAEEMRLCELGVSDAGAALGSSGDGGPAAPHGGPASGPSSDAGTARRGLDSERARGIVSKSGGCGCHVVGTRVRWRPWMGWAALAMVVVGSRARRSARSQRSG